MEKKENKMVLPKLDNIFSTQDERDNVNKEMVIDIPIEEIEEFPNHPFKVDNEELQDMVDSIKEKGVLVPTIVRPKGDGKYEMISGHRRKRASEILKNSTIPCIVRNLTDDEAIIIMVDSNLQREKILPSEKAFAYKMKLNAIKHQGKGTSRQVGEKLYSVDVLADELNESGRQVHRYIRLTELIPDFLKMVDNDILKLSPSMALSPAVELSFLTKQEQKDLLDIMKCNDCTPSLSQAINLKKLSLDGKLNVDIMEEMMEQSKPNQTPKFKVSMNRLSPVLPKSLRNDREKEEYIIKAVEWYGQYLLKKKERNEILR